MRNASYTAPHGAVEVLDVTETEMQPMVDENQI